MIRASCRSSIVFRKLFDANGVADADTAVSIARRRLRKAVENVAQEMRDDGYEIEIDHDYAVSYKEVSEGRINDTTTPL